MTTTTEAVAIVGRGMIGRSEAHSATLAEMLASACDDAHASIEAVRHPIDRADHTADVIHRLYPVYSAACDIAAIVTRDLDYGVAAYECAVTMAMLLQKAVEAAQADAVAAALAEHSA